MKIFNKLRKFGRSKPHNGGCRAKHKRGQLNFESVEGRVLMAGSVLDDMVSDVGMAAVAQQQSQNQSGPVVVAQVSKAQTGTNFLQPGNVANIIHNQIVATAKKWFDDGTPFKLAAKGKTPQQIVSEFVKQTTKGSLKELGRQGAVELTGLDLEKVDAIIEAGEIAVGVVTGDPTAYLNFAKKVAGPALKEGGENLAWLNDMAENDPGQPWRDPAKTFEKNLNEALKDAESRSEIEDDLQLGGLGGYTDPFIRNMGNTGTGGIGEKSEMPVSGAGNAGSGSSTTGGQSGTSQPNRADLPVDITPEKEPEHAGGYDDSSSADNGLIEDEHGGTDPGGDDPGRGGGDDPGPGGGNDPGPGGGNDPGPGGGNDPGPGGGDPGDGPGGEDPDPLDWYERDENGRFVPSPAPPKQDGGSSKDEPNDLLRQYDEDEILRDDDSDQNQNNGNGTGITPIAGNEGSDDNDTNDGSGSGDDGTSDGSSADTSDGSGDGSQGTDDAGNDDAGQDDGGYEDADGVTGFRPPPISREEFLDSMLKRAESWTNPAEPGGTGLDRDVTLELGEPGKDPRTINPGTSDDDPDENEDAEFVRPETGLGPDPAPMMMTSGGISGNTINGQNPSNNADEIPMSKN